MQRSDVLKLLISVIVAESAGFLGSLATTPSIPGWYATLVQPALTPPAWVFGPVWTTLYLLMGIAAFLVWREGSRQKKVRVALAIFIGQLVLNTLWSVLFFGSHSIGGALVEIVILWCAIVATIISFGRVSRVAAWFLVPYLLWVSFATYLNYAFWTLN